MRELKPCPFCRGNGKLSYRKMRFIGQNYKGDKKIKIGAQVICNRCKARGALCSGVVLRAEKEEDAAFMWITNKAIEAWNRMADVVFAADDVIKNCAKILAKTNWKRMREDEWLNK